MAEHSIFPLLKMKRKAKEPPEQKVIDKSNFSANDTLRVQRVHVLVLILIHDRSQSIYNSATTSAPWSTLFQIQALARLLLKTAPYRDSQDQMLKNEITCKNYFLKGLDESFQSIFELIDFIFLCLVFRSSTGAQR